VQAVGYHKFVILVKDVNATIVDLVVGFMSQPILISSFPNTYGKDGNEGDDIQRRIRGDRD